MPSAFPSGQDLSGSHGGLFNQHIEAAVQLDCDHMVVSTGFAYLDVDAEDSFGWVQRQWGALPARQSRRA